MASEDGMQQRIDGVSRFDNVLDQPRSDGDPCAENKRGGRFPMETSCLFASRLSYCGSDDNVEHRNHDR
jgi:hypothetical protein